MTEPTKAKCGPLSHSSAKTLLGCEQKYVNYKVKGLPYDEDYERSDAFAIGSAFHYVLETTKHEKPEAISTLLDHCEKDKDIGLDPSDRNLVHAMVIKYLRLHKKMGFKVLEVEFKLETKNMIGYVDAIMEDPNGKWWIVDLKTAKTLYLPGVPALPQDPQLNLYAAHAPMIAEMFNLPLENFAGCRWRVATKSQANQKEGEEDVDFVKRLLKGVKCYDIEVPLEKMSPVETLERHTELWKISKKLYHPDAKPKKNFGDCMSYFKPCSYWSACHGTTYTATELNIETEA